ncbi:MAG TPA: heparan-alpha-glucosaminide N-acetyltransferase domain-containing protein [Chiayiivirga sp.]|nr:heparan-alpha-glucosaminide N-acetyltransferase domain-containing protein [Chiayiivirga sp.]
MTSNPTRLASVDALRGITVAAMLLVNDPGTWGAIYAPLEHAPWHGCTPTDLIFPFFLFIVGVSLSLSLLPRLERGDDRGVLLRSALWRAARIVALGVLINLLAWWLIPDRPMRWPGVLQRIGLVFALVAPLALHARPRTWALLIVALLGGYAALLAAGGTLDPFANIASRVDSAVFGGAVWSIDPATGRGHDPEGLLSTLPSIATALLGLCTGYALRRKQLRAIAVGAIAALALGWLWSCWQPFNKNLWTPAFVLWTAGLATLALLLAHWLNDQRGWPALGRRFGVNAIAAYGGSQLMAVLLESFGWQAPIYQHGFASWIEPLAGAKAASLAFALAFVGFWWLIVWAMDRKRLYLKI